MLLRVLVVLDDAPLRKRVTSQLEELGAVVKAETRPANFWVRLGRESYDLVVTSREAMPGSVSDSIGEVRKLPERPEVIVFSESNRPEDRALLQTAGSFAVLHPGLSDEDLRSTLATLLRRYREIGLARLRAAQGRASSLSDFASSSAAMQRLLDLARRVVAADTSLLILGETGVGKEWLARAIHAEGPRSSGPFVAVNCAAVPEALLESELFGHERGAFTGAVRDRRGAFEVAHRGTLFLDEIGDLPLHLQVKLLRALQERQIQRIGAERPVAVDVRIMAATNRDLEFALRSQQFRRDLYYRLSVVTLTIPPLRERAEEIPALAVAYLERFRSQLGRPFIRGFSEATIEALAAYTWPGNVRELINVVERAVLLCDTEEIRPADLPDSIRGDSVGGTSPPPATQVGSRRQDWLDTSLPEARRRWIEELERDYLQRLLEATGGSVSETARRAGIETRTLYNKMKAYGLRKEDYRRPTSAASPGLLDANGGRL